MAQALVYFECENRHLLQEGKVGRKGVTCDECDKKIATNTAYLTCDKCNYDMCHKCVVSKIAAPAAPPAPAALPTASKPVPPERQFIRRFEPGMK